MLKRKNAKKLGPLRPFGNFSSPLPRTLNLHSSVAMTCRMVRYLPKSHFRLSQWTFSGTVKTISGIPAPSGRSPRLNSECAFAKTIGNRSLLPQLRAWRMREHAVMSQRYQFAPRDAELLWAATRLLHKVAAAGKLGAPQQVTIAKLQRVLACLPHVSGRMIASVTAFSPPFYFGRVAFRHWWKFGADEGMLKLSSGGLHNRPDTGEEKLTAMTWCANSSRPSSLNNDFGVSALMGPNWGSYREGVESIDFATEGYSIEIFDNENRLLGDEDYQAPKLAGTITSVNDAEVKLAACVDLDEIDARARVYAEYVRECVGCGCSLNQRGLFVVGPNLPTMEWKSICAECFGDPDEFAASWSGQIFARQSNGDWRRVKGRIHK